MTLKLTVVLAQVVKDVTNRRNTKTSQAPDKYWCHEIRTRTRVDLKLKSTKSTKFY